MCYRIFVLQNPSSIHYLAFFRYYCIFTYVFSPYLIFILNFVLLKNRLHIHYQLLFPKRQCGKKLEKVAFIWRKLYILSKSKHDQPGIWGFREKERCFKFYKI